MAKREPPTPRPAETGVRLSFRAHFTDGKKLDFFADDITEARWKVRPLVENHGPRPEAQAHPGEFPPMKRFAENPTRAFTQLGVRLPVRLSDHEVGEVLDADGQRVLTVDPDGVLADDAADDIASFIALMVNAVAMPHAFPVAATGATVHKLPGRR